MASSIAIFQDPAAGSCISNLQAVRGKTMLDFQGRDKTHRSFYGYEGVVGNGYPPGEVAVGSGVWVAVRLGPPEVMDAVTVGVKVIVAVGTVPVAVGVEVVGVPLWVMDGVSVPGVVVPVGVGVTVTDGVTGFSRAINFIRAISVNGLFE
jgi:hypothetical protein